MAFGARTGDFLLHRRTNGLAHGVLYPVTVLYPRREHTQTVENRISSKPPPPASDPVSLGDLCQAMFIEGARVLGFSGEAPMPREVQERVFLAATLVADGFGLLLQDENDDDQELAG